MNGLNRGLFCVTSPPPAIIYAVIYDEAIMKQFMTLSSEYYVFLSVLIMKNNTKIKVPNVSDIIAWNTPFASYVGLIFIDSLPIDKKNIAKAPKIAPANCPSKYMNPFNLLFPKFEFFLNISATVTAGLKCAPVIFTANKLITQYPKNYPAKFPAIKK
jgi:hypothetical protein